MSADNDSGGMWKDGVFVGSAVDNEEDDETGSDGLISCSFSFCGLMMENVASLEAAISASVSGAAAATGSGRGAGEVCVANEVRLVGDDMDDEEDSG